MLDDLLGRIVDARTRVSREAGDNPCVDPRSRRILRSATSTMSWRRRAGTASTA